MYTILRPYKYTQAKSQIVKYSIHFFIVAFFSIQSLKAQTYPPGFNQVLVANGIASPTVMAFAPDGRLFVAQQTGALRVIENGVLLSTPFITLGVNSSGERGLLGIAFDPNFNTNHFIYLYYTLFSGLNNRISRFTANGNVVVAGSEVVVLDLDPLSTATNHNGGNLQFGPDGTLYVGVGENANGLNSQNLDTYLGKILRINSDGTVPAGNPFTSGSAQRQRVWEYGMRNPYTLSIQPGTGRIFVNDVGENTWEEVNDCTTGGGNYGWPNAEGVSSNSDYVNPIYAYQHGAGIGFGCAITGGTFFNPTSTNYPSQYMGMYFFLDFCNNWIDMLTLSGNTATRANFASSIAGFPVCMLTGPDGNLYFLSRNNSAVYKVTFTGSTALAPLADAYVNGGKNANANFGTAGTLLTQKNSSVNKSYETYLKFDISSFSANVSSAKLRLNGRLNNTQTPSIPVEVHNSTNTTWLENTITWNNKPAADAAILATTNVNSTTNQYYEWDLTTHIASLRTAGINLVTLKLVNTNSSNNQVIFNSKEAAANRPELVVTDAGGTITRRMETSESNGLMAISVYPNPVKEQLIIHNNSESAIMKIYDVTGKMVKQTVLTASVAQQVAVGDLRNGMYVVKIYNDKGSTVKKIFVQK